MTLFRHKQALPSRSSPATGESLPETNRRVWDMVLNLVHPAFLYVLFELLIQSRLHEAPLLVDLGPLSLPALAIYLLQFLGAWAIFYTTLLRDMGERSPEGTWLLLTGFLGAALVYPLFPTPRSAASFAVGAYIGVQLLLAGTVWILVMRRWGRARSAPPAEPPREKRPA